MNNGPAQLKEIVQAFRCCVNGFIRINTDIPHALKHGAMP